MKPLARSSTQRYSKISLPKKRYMPGQDLHPDKDPKGSHIPEIPATKIKFSAGLWQESEKYLYAIDLFNYQYFWEAHEVLEGLWIEIGRETPTGVFVQGIIQVSAALLKEVQSSHKGALRLANKGLLKLNSKSGVFLGVRIDSFTAKVKSFLAGKQSSFPFILLKIE